MTEPQKGHQGDGSSISATPFMQRNEVQDLGRTQPVDRADKRPGYMQVFRGNVGANSEVVLNTSGGVLNTVNFGILRGGTSQLTISGIPNASGTGGELSASPSKDNPKANRARAAIGKAMKLNSIYGVIRAPIDQALQMTVLFGESYHSNHPWKGVYTNGGRYVIETKGPAEVAQIRLKNSNPLNPGWYNFHVSILILPPKAAGATDPFSSAFFSDLRKAYEGSGFRDLPGLMFPY